MPISFAERMRREKEDKYAQERGEAGLNRLSKKELIQHIQDLYAFENIFMVHENRSHPCRQKYDTLKAEIRKLKAEIETLKDAERKRDVRDYNDVFTKLKQENERLKWEYDSLLETGMGAPRSEWVDYQEYQRQRQRLQDCRDYNALFDK